MATTYSPKKVIVTFNGRILTGYAAGTFIEAERESDAFTKDVGADGETARVASADRSGRVTLTLMQTSDSNDYLSTVAATDELTQTGTGALFIKDTSGRSLVTAGEAWVKKVPKASFAKDNGEREWVFETGDIQITNNGN
jgi:hypothetical protein